MTIKISVQEAPIEEAVKVSARIREFDAKYPREYFEKRYEGKDKLIIIGYADGKPAGYIIGYDRYEDGSFYAWMAGVELKYRRMGIMNAMMKFFTDWSKKRGYNKIRVKTRNNRRNMLSYLIAQEYQFTNVEKKDNIEDYRISLEKKL